jgi:hypothetical protein
MPVATTQRVENNTADSLERRFDEQLESNINKYAGAGVEEIDQRLRELDSEWNIERIIEIEAPTMIGLGAVLGATVSRSWFALSAMAASMVILHNMQGWYPMLPLFRRLGIRTQNEIEQERSALRALRGDYRAYQSQTRH